MAKGGYGETYKPGRLQHSGAFLNRKDLVGVFRALAFQPGGKAREILSVEKVDLLGGHDRRVFLRCQGHP